LSDADEHEARNPTTTVEWTEDGCPNNARQNVIDLQDVNKTGAERPEAQRHPHPQRRLEENVVAHAFGIFVHDFGRILRLLLHSDLTH
jgi:hypothetical protein